MKGRGGVVVSVYRRVEEVLPGALEVVLFPQAAEEAFGGAEVGNCALLATTRRVNCEEVGERTACRNGYASAGNDDNLLLFMQDVHDAFQLLFLVIIQLAVGGGRVQV